MWKPSGTFKEFVTRARQTVRRMRHHSLLNMSTPMDIYGGELGNLVYNRGKSRSHKVHKKWELAHATRTAGPEEASGRDRQRCSYCADRDRRTGRDDTSTASQAQERFGGGESASGKHDRRRTQGHRTEGRNGEVGVMANHHAIGVANAVLQSAEEQGFSVTPMQLQKLVYFCNGWNLELRNEPLVSDNFEAWQYGPVHPSIYHEFKTYGQEAIRSGSNLGFGGDPVQANLSSAEASLIDEVVRIYGGLSGPQMSNLTHRSGTPWSETWNNGLGKGNSIPSLRIADEFRALRQRAA